MTFQPRKHLRNGIAAIALVVSLVPAAMAQDITEAHLTAARDALAAIHATDIYDAILPAAAEQIKAQLISNNIDLEDVITKTVDEQALALASRRADLEREAARIYAAAFTEEELQDIVKFYNSEAGKKLLKSGPTAAREIDNAAAIWKRGVERDLLENITKSLNDQGVRAPTPAPQNGDGAKTQN